MGERGDPTTCCLKQTYFRCKDRQRLKVKRWKKIFLVNGNQKAKVATLISGKK